MACNGKRSGDVVTARLPDDADVGREVLVQRSGEHSSHGLEGGIASEATANIERVHVEAKGGRLVKDEAGVLNSLDEGFGVRRTRANVECHADNVELQLLRELKQLAGLIHSSTELLAQAAQAGRVIGDDAQVQLSVGEELLGLVELVGVVEGHLLDASVGSIADVRLGLAGLRVDDAGGVDADLENRLDLVFGSAVEAESELGHEAQDLGVWVTLDRCSSVRNDIAGGQLTGLTIVRLDASQVLLPSQVLTVDLAQVSDEESVLVADVTDVVVDSLDTALQSCANELLGGARAIVVNGAKGTVVEILFVFQRGVVFLWRGRESRRCHSLASSCWG